MKGILLVCRLLLGVIVLIFGLNLLLHFLPLPMPTGDALAWFGIMTAHHWMNFVGAVQVIAAILLLVGRFVPLALTLLAPVIVNILLYHSLLWTHFYIPAIVAAVLEIILLLEFRRNFYPLLAPDAEGNTRIP